MPQVTIDFPSGGVTNGMIATSAGVAASKLVCHRSIDVELFGPSTTVTALTRDIHIVRGATGTAIGLEAAICGTIATGADRTITLDVHRSTGAGAFSTMLSSTIGFTNASVLRTAVAAVFNSTALVDGDVIRLIVTVAGAAGNQALGLFATFTYEETFS